MNEAEKKVVWPVMDLIDESEMPMPRLELRWKPIEGWETCRCSYFLVLPLDDLDIRNHKRLGKDGARFKRVPMGRPTIRNSFRPAPEGACSPLRKVPVLTEPRTIPPDFKWTVEPPFRDGAHARWDSAKLGIPAYAVCEGKAVLLHDGTSPGPFGPCDALLVD